MKKPLVILTGPTAVGKTEFSINLAKAIGGEIVSADSMQVYRGMDIGSAKIKPQEMCGVTHHLIDVLDPDEEFHVVRFQKMARQAMEEVYARKKIPILVGGTGFYIQAVLYDVDFAADGGDGAYREELRRQGQVKGAEYLHEKLALVDPEYAAQVHANNQKKVIRALEFFHSTGQKLSEHNVEQAGKDSPYNFAYFVLNDERARVYGRIDRRVEQMVEEGLVAEVRGLKEKGYTRELVSMQGLGYKEILDYLDGRTSLSEAVEIIKRDTRHFAKRQITWFKRERDTCWLDKDKFGHDEARMLEAALDVLRERGIVGIKRIGTKREEDDGI